MVTQPEISPIIRTQVVDGNEQTRCEAAVTELVPWNGLCWENASTRSAHPCLEPFWNR